MQTRHARIRAQQRGLTVFIDQLLDQYGKEAYDGRGGVLVYFDKSRYHQMVGDMSREDVRRLPKLRDAYKVRSSTDGCTITIGHRHSRIMRK